MPGFQLPEIQKWVSAQVSPPRLSHIQGVVQVAEKLAARYGLPVSKVHLAAWLHDCAKEQSKAEMMGWIKKNHGKLDQWEKALPGLWHPHAAVGIALRKWGIKDITILEAIRCHTLGNPGMGPLAQLIFIADFIEPGRSFSGVSLARKAAFESLKSGVLMKASMTIEFLLEKRMKIHPRLLETWNAFCGGEA